MRSPATFEIMGQYGGDSVLGRNPITCHSRPSSGCTRPHDQRRSAFDGRELLCQGEFERSAGCGVLDLPRSSSREIYVEISQFAGEVEAMHSPSADFPRLALDIPAT